MKGIFCRYLRKSGSPKKTYPFISGYVFFAQEIDPCQEFANSAKQNLAADLRNRKVK